ncbi:hypothetical protein ACS0TY_035295 [Phlomoides rotata]
MTKWIEELQDQPWSRAKKANDQPGFNWALNKTTGQISQNQEISEDLEHWELQMGNPVTLRTWRKKTNLWGYSMNLRFVYLLCSHIVHEGDSLT